MPDLLLTLRQWAENIAPGGRWYRGGAGLWYLYLDYARSTSRGFVGFRPEELTTLVHDAEEAPKLRADLARLRAALDEIADGCQCRHPDPYAIGQCSCQADIAVSALNGEVEEV